MTFTAEGRTLRVSWRHNDLAHGFYPESTECYVWEKVTSLVGEERWDVVAGGECWVHHKDNYNHEEGRKRSFARALDRLYGETGHAPRSIAWKAFLARRKPRLCSHCGHALRRSQKVQK